MRTKNSRRSLLALGLLVCLPQLSHAVLPVIDEANVAQAISTAISAAAIVKNTAQEVTAQYNIIFRQIQQLQWMYDNLQRLDDNFNLSAFLQVIGGNLAELLGATDGLSYDIGTVNQQFDELYRQVGKLQTTRDVLTLRQRLNTSKMSGSQLTIQVTAIRRGLTDLYTRFCLLLGGSWGAKGALDSAQVQSQQLGILQSTMASSMAIQAAHARAMAQQEAEKATQDEINLRTAGGTMGNAKDYDAVNGKLPQFKW